MVGGVADSYSTWPETYKQVDWEETYRKGRWDYLTDLSELPRYALIAGHIHKLLKTGTVLDAGCGEGILSDYLDLGRIDYTGFDLSALAVERASQRLAPGTVFYCSIEDFEPSGNKQYDAIVFNEAVQCISTPLESIDRYRKFLSPRGFIAVSLFKNPNQSANGPRLSRFLSSAIETGKFSQLNRVEGHSVLNGMAWEIFFLK